MHPHTFTALALALSFFGTNAFAQTPDTPLEIEKKVVQGTNQRMVFTLEQVIQKTLEVSPSIQSSMYSLEEAQAVFEKAKRASVLPEFSARIIGGVVPDTPPDVGPEFGFPDAGLFDTDWGPFYGVRLDAVQPIYTFGKIKNLQEAAQQGVNAGEQGIIKARNEMILQSKRVYLNLANLFSYLEFIQELIGRSKKAAEIVKDRLANNESDVTNIDLIRIEVFQAESERRKIEILHTIDFLKVSLKILMGLPRHFDLDIADHKIRMDNKRIDVVEHFLQLAKTSLPEVQQLEYMVEAKKNLMEEKKSQKLPTLGLAGFYEFNRAPGREDIDNPFLVNNLNNHVAGGTLFLQQNLAFHLLDSDHKKAKAAYEKSIADKQAAYQLIEVRIRQAYNEALSRQEAFEQSKLAFKKVRSWVLAATLNFGVGVVPPKDLVEAFVAYSKVKNEYLETLFNYRWAIAKLKYATGNQ